MEGQYNNYSAPQQPVQDERFRNFFSSPNEQFVCALGMGYFQKFISDGSLDRGFVVVSNEKIYIKGNMYSDTGDGLIRKSISATVGLKNFARAEHRQPEEANKIMAIFSIIFTILCFIGTIATWNLAAKWLPIVTMIGGISSLFMSIMFTKNCNDDKKQFFKIYFDWYIVSGCNNVVLPAEWFMPNECDTFMTKLMNARMAIADPDDPFQNTFRNFQDSGPNKPQHVGQAPMTAQNVQQPVSPQPEYQAPVQQPVSPQPANQQTPGSAADELAKYAQLYKEGMITEQEYAEVKARILSK